jgi:DedD protein
MDFLLKQRLVGAIVLVALGVIFIPMLLEEPEGTLMPGMEELPEFRAPRPSEPLDSFPAADALPDEPARAVVMEEASPEPLQNQADAPREPAPEPAAEEQATAAVEPESAEPETEPVPAPDKDPVEAGPLGNWIVQVGSFSSQQNALALRDKLRKDGFVTQVEKVRVEGKTHYRVRVGPFLERADADRNQRELGDKFSLKARVLSYP